ncbi:MAG TPA: sigma-54-dependent Fis family transcriptional regulator [Devosia sp.]|nr:sigma-54-dependent Fis family transcriptional regulator [Devosia sp.]
MTKILVVDDDPVQLRLTEALVRKDGFETLTASGGQQALDLLEQDKSIAALILDLVMPDIDGMAVMEEMARRQISCPVIVQTANSSLDSVVSAMRHGAVDFFVKPVAPERLIISLRNALKLGALETCVRRDQNRREGRMKIADIITASPSMDRVLELAGKAARSNIPVLIEGESGVGKEVVARAIQGSSERAGKAFVTVNCGAIPINLIESTLFGHAKGAFTGAIADHRGKFVEADGGTLFLDEVGELPPQAQVKLLRAIQFGDIEPLGGEKIRKVNVRLISATNRRLLNLTKAGNFRQDLYYRLNVFPLYVPPLRDRIEDIAVLAEHFIASLGAEAGRRVLGLSPPALDLLKSYDWPGNVRQLENAIYRAIVLTETSKLVPLDFPQIVAGTTGRNEARQQSEAIVAPGAPVHIDAPAMVTRPARPGPDHEMKQAPLEGPQPEKFLASDGNMYTLARMERDMIAFALDFHGGRMTRIARDLGIGRSTLYRKIKEYGLEPRQPSSPDNPDTRQVA